MKGRNNKKDIQERKRERKNTSKLSLEKLYDKTEHLAGC
jgi:hypothetical protein